MTTSTARPLERADERPPGVVTRLAEREAVQRLEILVAVSRVLSGVVDDYRSQLHEIAEVCVPDFCDLLAIEIVGGGGGFDLAALRCAAASGVRRPDLWPFLGPTCAHGRQPVLTYRGGHATPAADAALERLGADSLIVAPILTSGITQGWLILATGPRRRGFRPSAVGVAADVAMRLGAAMQRGMLVREARLASQDRARTARWLRRVANVAAAVAGAATPREVLEAGCVEACNLHDADGVAIRWTSPTGQQLHASAGAVDPSVAREALAGADERRPTRSARWVSWPLVCADPSERATIILFRERELEPEEELSLRSLASLIPIAFDRARGAEATARHEAHLRAVLEGSPAALLTLGPDGRIESNNAAARRLFGTRPEAHAWDLPGGVRDAVARLALEAAATGDRQDGVVAADGFDLAVSVAPLLDPGAADGRSVVVVATDLSEQHRAERALLQAQKLEAIGQVAGGVAHDFNNLLTLITGYSQVLSHSVQTEAERRLLEEIDRATDRAAALTRRMLGLTRRQVGVRRPIALDALLSSLGGVLQRLAGEGVVTHLELPGEAVAVSADPAELEQVVLNLAINARDALGGTGNLTLRVDTVGTDDGTTLGLPGDSHARLTVVDDGPGMSAEVLAHCMEPFFTTKPNGAGSGLGLSSVLATVTDLGGTLDVQSCQGEGTSVEVRIPLATDPLPEATPGSAAAPAPISDLRILVVEDDADLRSLTAAALTAAGAAVVARSDADGLGAGRKDPAFDVLVTDVRLPGVSGLELAARFRSLRPELPVLFVTGYADPLVERLESLPGPRPGLLRKPFRPDDLQAAVVGVAGAQGSKR